MNFKTIAVLLGTDAHNCHGKRINLTAKKKNLAAKRKRLTAKFLRCREDILILIFRFGREVNSFAVFFFLPWGFSFCREVILFAVSLFLVAVRLIPLPWQLSATVCQRYLGRQNTERKRKEDMQKNKSHWDTCQWGPTNVNYSSAFKIIWLLEKSYLTNSYLIFENRRVIEYKISVGLCSCGILVTEELR